ncbi:hypothetical protein ABGB18_49240 [Nonomuraea sp. B12E4]|uniref:hypothetical protein n=1 Tax=Nonomuraea sp. B12E4 TaxID=3153564 RepID=UPI00325E555C
MRASLVRDTQLAMTEKAAQKAWSESQIAVLSRPCDSEPGKAPMTGLFVQVTPLDA